MLGAVWETPTDWLAFVQCPTIFHFDAAFARLPHYGSILSSLVYETVYYHHG